MVEYVYTKEQAAQMRQKVMDNYALPTIKLVFEKYPQVNSATLLVAQYWDDNANDAVHERFIYSRLETPDLEAAFKAEDLAEIDGVMLVDTVNLGDDLEIGWTLLQELYQQNDSYYWDDNGEAITAFAAFCKEGCHQEMSTREAYVPYAILRRKGNDIEVEIVGQMLRSWLDGVKPEEWDGEWLQPEHLSNRLTQE